MDDGQRNRLRMFRAVGDFLKKEEARWSAVPANGVAYADLVAGIGVIEGTVRRQEKALEGISARKQALRKVLENAVLRVGEPAASYAAASGNVLLAAETNVGPNLLSHLPEQGLTGTAVRLAGAVGPHMVALADYAVLPGDVAALEKALADYKKVLRSPDVARAQRTGETKLLKSQMSAVSTLLSRRMDKLMARYRVSDPVLYAGYKAARVVIDLRGPGK